MNRTHRFIAAVLPVSGAFLLFAANGEPSKSPEKTPNYNADRSFAQPVREDPVGSAITSDRAFWGAPPPMPHGFVEERRSDCLTCHARETRISCQQCHVDGSDAELEVFRENLFVGLDFPGKGTRAHDYAPPTIPHKTFMRDNCLSCHGPSGKQKIATPHPYRSQCQQCHVSDASKNYDRPLPWSELEGKL